MIAVLLAAGLATLAAAGCSDPEDRAAKRRIFSPEEPPKPVLAASEPIDAAALGRDPALGRRVLTMSAAEALERIGAHRFVATASFDWVYGSDKVALSEKRQVEQVGSTDFAIHTENSEDNGFDIIHLGTRTFARRKFHPFRERKRDRGQAAKLRDEVYGLLSSAVSLTGERLGLVPDGTDSVAGRRAQRYLFTLLDKKVELPAKSSAKVPPVVFQNGGPDAATKLRLDFANLRSPKSVEGRLWVDTETGVPLKSELAAVIAAPSALDSADKGQGEAILTLRLGHALEAIGEKLAVAAPEEYLPDEDRPNAIAAALARFGVGRQDKNAEQAPAAEPADEE
ncbi:MAG: hypothetical protein ACOX6T_04050 [Myxococcales bacterium]|jgi:hypothetical protein